MEADYARLETDASAPPVEIVWDGVGVAAGAKEILVEAHGRAVSGRVLALMGPSGAGKTTLLNALSERAALAAGVVVVDAGGGPRPSVAFLQQDEVFLGMLTAREHLRFAARLRHWRAPFAEREARVDAVLTEFGLADVADGAVGAPATERLSAVRGRGLSGGERKRLGIALEALGAPRVFYLDEPTTGLDSGLALGVVASLRRLAARETLVVLSVHQPGARAFALFDDLVVLAKGRTAYHGPAAPATAALEAVAGVARADLVVSDSERLMELVGSEGLPKLVAAAARARGPPPAAKAGARYAARRVGAPRRCRVAAVVARMTLNLLREWPLLAARLVLSVVMAVLAGSMYRRAGCGVDARGVPDVTGCLFIICTSALFSSFFPCIGLIGKSMPLAYRESAGGLYEISAHLVAYVVTDAPVQVFLAAANMAIVYVMVDPRCGKGSGDDRAHFLAFLLVAQLVAYAGAGLGYCLPAVLPVEVALIVAPVVVYPCILFGGLYERSVDIPWYFAWWNSVNPLYFGLNALAVSEWRTYGDVAFPFADGKAVLEFYGLGNLSFSASCWSLLAVGTGLRVFVFAYLELHAAWAKRG